jgi:hypothetical protein
LLPFEKIIFLKEIKRTRSKKLDVEMVISNNHWVQKEPLISEEWMFGLQAGKIQKPAIEAPCTKCAGWLPHRGAGNFLCKANVSLL